MNTPSAKQDRWIGKVIAEKFRVDALIGEGAMGLVYRGEQLSLGKPVALKVLHKHLSGDPRIHKRFHREALAASRLSHANSVTIIDFGEASDGTLFIAMELLEGENLQAIIDHDAPFTPARIGSVMVQTLRALDEAHHAGIIHRDLKPENVLVATERGGEPRVKVCDFGIAKIMEGQGTSTAITKDGYVCGTPEYMAPEQARGDALDIRADIYSAGAMLYQMLCGRVPFVAETALGVITKHIMEPPDPPRSVRPEWSIPRSLERIALRALSKTPDERFASATEMAAAIESAGRELGPRANERLGEGSFRHDAAAPSTDEAIAKAVPRRARGLRWIALLVVALTVFAFGVWLWVVPDPPPRRAPARRSTPPAQVAQQPNEEREPANVEPPTPLAAVDPQVDPAPRPRPARPREPAPPSEVMPAEPAPDPGASALDEGRRLMLEGDLPGAIARFEEAARATPSNARVHKELGRAYMRAGDIPRGIGAYRRYLALAPDAPDRAIVERIIAQHGGK